MKIAKRALAIFIFGIVVPVSAQNAGNRPVLMLNTAIDAALANNPGLHALQYKVKSASQNAKSRFRNHFGELSAVASYSFLNDHQVLRPMSKEMMSGGLGGLPFERNQLHYGLVFKLPIYLGGKLYSGVRIARLESKKTAALLEGSRWTVRFNVTSLYAAGQALDEVIRALGEQVDALEHTRENLVLMVKDGKRPDIDRLKVVESLEEVKAILSDARSRRTRVVAMLLALMGKDPDADIRLAPAGEGLPGLNRGTDLNAMLEQTSTIRRAALAWKQADHAVGLSLSTFIPHFYAFANWMQHYGPTVSSPMNTWVLGLKLDIPLLSGGSRFADLSAAKARRNAAKEALQQARLQARARLKAALASYKSAREQLRSARARLAAGTEAARIEQIRYDTGAGTIEDLLRARARKEGAGAELARTMAAIRTAAERVNMTVEKEVVR